MKIGKIRINMIEDDSYKDKENAYANIGESIQAVAMSYIYDKIGIKKENIVKIPQCKIKSYRGEDLIFPIRLPLSRETVDNFFPLNKCIKPIFISLHLHNDIFEGREDLVSYFKQFTPIGCRDEHSCSYFRKHGIEAYIMGCYTICLPKRKMPPVNGVPFLIDISKELNQVIPSEIKEKAVYLSHAVPFEQYPVTIEEDERLENLSKNYLKRYRDEASCVITSRLHAAAPCLAMGIPVVLASNNVDFRYAWIDKYLKIYQENDYTEIDWKQWENNDSDIDKAKEMFFRFMEQSLQQGKSSREDLQQLDYFYRTRNKTLYYKCFRERLQKLKQQYSEQESFDYGIWGAGCHAIFAYELMGELFPNAKLKVVIDKYKTGELFGVPIIKERELNNYNVQHICITTNPGLSEAMQKCTELWGDNAAERYSIMISQQKS